MVAQKVIIKKWANCKWCGKQIKTKDLTFIETRKGEVHRYHFECYLKKGKKQRGEK